MTRLTIALSFYSSSSHIVLGFFFTGLVLSSTINTNVFDDIHRWVCESFNTIKSFGTPGIALATWAFPILTDASSKPLFNGLVLTSKFLFILVIKLKFGYR